MFKTGKLSRLNCAVLSKGLCNIVISPTSENYQKYAYVNRNSSVILKLYTEKTNINVYANSIAIPALSKPYSHIRPWRE